MTPRVLYHATTPKKAKRYHFPATLELAEELFKTCGHSGCRELAVFVLVAGGQEQVFCCLDHGRIGVEADKMNPGHGRKAANQNGT